MPHIAQNVHFFTDAPARQRDGMGAGPYAAMIVRLHDDGAVDLTVFYPGDVRCFSRLTREGTNRWSPIEARS